MVSLLNDSIFVCGEHNLDTLDLKYFSLTEDYANPIEPSHQGGLKFAEEKEWVGTEI